MARFEKALFQDDGMYVHYMHNGQRKFVVRFKYGGRGTFISFLKKNFTPDEYFAQLENSTPVEVLESRGWLHPSKMKACLMHGYPATREGFEQYLKDKVQMIMVNVGEAK